MRKVDGDFSPPLSSRVDLKAYAKKLCRGAVTIIVVGDEKQEILGASSFYCNPESYDQAYLSFFAVLPAVRGNGYAHLMMTHSVEYAREAGMHSIETRTWRGNTPMIQLLEKFGYHFTEKKMDSTGRTSFHYRLGFDRLT